jgi:hypothetical protein
MSTDPANTWTAIVAAIMMSPPAGKDGWVMATTTLEFDTATKRDDQSLSGAAAVGNFLFVAPDEGASIVRLQRHNASGNYRAATEFAVADCVSVPGATGDEIDLEGMDIANGFVWMVGSHSAVRARVKKSTPPDEVPDLLVTVTHPPARRFLARVPLSVGPEGPQPVASTKGSSGKTVLAASLPDDGVGVLARLLSQDLHLSPFIEVPGKDNGLDIEGLAVIGSRVLLGLRGPVLRGWAVIIEIQPRPCPEDPTTLELGPINGPEGPRYAKHFLDLHGLGIRDLARHGEDLLILAGPTMVLDGPSRVLRLRQGAHHPLPEVVTHSQLEEIGELPMATDYDRPVKAGHDHPEAITVLGEPQQRLLVLYDSPSKQRSKHNNVLADLLPLS